jgi:type IV pilus assembly protein PilA
MIETIRNRMEREEGFTLIELLVVILIIGILAAIAIPSFLNQREKGQDTCAKTQARTMATAMETYYTDTNGYTAGMASLNGVETAITGTGACGTGTSAAIGMVAPTAGACTGTATGSGSAWCVSQTSASGASFAIYRAANAAPTRSCGGTGRVGQGGCPSTGTW